MGYFEWSNVDVRRAVNEAIKAGRTSVALSMDKNTHENELQVVKWVEEMGYKAKREMERVVVTL